MNRLIFHERMMTRSQAVSFAMIIVVLIGCPSQETQQPSQSNAHREAQSPSSPVSSPLTVPDMSAGKGRTISIGQTIYVPIYSHIYYQNKSRVLNLTATLSIRNTDLTRSILVTAVRYYDTNGDVVKEYVAQPLQLAPLATTEVVVEERDTRGGSGANFIVEWSARELVTEPIVEAVMVNSSLSLGLAFVSPGRVIRQHTE